MNKPKISDKRWSIDLERKIQENHYAEAGKYYSFNKEK